MAASIPTAPTYLGPDPLAPEFRVATAVGSAAGLLDLCDEPGPRALRFPFLQPAACARLCREIAARRGAAASAPNSMHEYGVVLQDLGMTDLLVWLRQVCVAPMTAAAFADVVAVADFDDDHGFLAEYGAAADGELGFHVDDSAVTLNVCLALEGLVGGELYFRGLRCDRHRDTLHAPVEAFELEHRVGTAVVHAGRHRHGVDRVYDGSRQNLILWCRSAVAHAAAGRCPAWCGAHAAL